MAEMCSKSLLLAIIDSIRATVESAPSGDAAAHDKLLAEINTLLLAAETPFETCCRIGYLPWQEAAIRIAIDLQLFKHVVDAGEAGIDAEALAQKTRAEARLIVRLQRVLVALGLGVAGPDGRYRASSKTAILTQAQGIDAFKFWVDISLPTAAKLPEYFRMRSYTTPHESAHSAFAYEFGSEFWTWMSSHEEQSAVFNRFMATRRIGKPSWFEVYDFELNLVPGLDQESDTVALVDVGGNKGHDLMKMRDMHPELKGRLVLQDLTEVISNCDFGKLHGIRTVEHDFFKPQPITGARAYHFRSIFHDWPDEQCRQILKHTVDVMRPGYSKILISEFILSDNNTRLFPVSLDLQMMGLHAGSERSYSQWKELLDSSGLAILKVWQRLEGGEGVIEAVQK